MHEQRREFTRIPTHLSLRIAGEADRDFEVSSLSLGGAYLRPVPTGAADECDCTLVSGQPGSEDEVTIRVHARIARRDGEGAAIQFTEIHGAESWNHLRELVRLRSGGDDEIEQDFERHVGIERRLRSD